MDKIRLFIFISVLGGLIYLGFIYDRDRGVIDDEYIASESYRQLEEKIQGEQKSTVPAEQKIRIILQEVILSGDSKELELPLNKISSTLSGNNSNWNTLFDLRFKNIGKVKRDSLVIHFVLVQEKKNYDESGLFMTTSEKDSLLAFQTIGQFKHTVTEIVETQVYIKNSGVVVAEISRKKLYPVEQENMNIYSYEILESGRIEQLKN